MKATKVIPSVDIALALRRGRRFVLCDWDLVWREVKPLKENSKRAILVAKLKTVFDYQ